MLLKYQFPAVKGYQAGKEYYICMVPLGLLSKIFISDNGDVAPEYRAQRKLNESRIPEIRDYILNNRDSYVFSALAASIDGDVNFIPTHDGAQVGVLEVDMDASFLIDDRPIRMRIDNAACADRRKRRALGHHAAAHRRAGIVSAACRNRNPSVITGDLTAFVQFRKQGTVDP